TAELSDSAGNFSTPVIIGTQTASSSGSMPIRIPDGRKFSETYRIRINASTPAVTGNPTSVFTIKGLPLTIGVIAGPAYVCAFKGSTATATYSVAVVPGATQYNWVAPANATIVSGQGTNSIQVKFA